MCNTSEYLDLLMQTRELDGLFPSMCHIYCVATAVTAASAPSTTSAASDASAGCA